MSDDRQRHLALATLLLVLVLVVTAAVAIAESQSRAEENGDRQAGAVAEEYSKRSASAGQHGLLPQSERAQPPSAASERPPGDSNVRESSRPALDRQVQDVPAIEAKPDTTDESKQPPSAAPDRPATPVDTEAEDSPRQPSHEKPEQDVRPAEAQPQNGLTAKTLKPIAPDEAVGILGKKVHGPAGEDMGMIVDVLVDGEGKPLAALIDFGGFLGVGTRKIATDWQLLQFRPGDRSQPVLLSLGKEELRASPEYKPSIHPAEIVAPPPPPEAPAAADAEK